MKVSIGQDSHRFSVREIENKKLILGGVVFEGEPPLEANSDGDVILHAITNAISGVTCKNVLGEVADVMCKNGITDSKEYLYKATEGLDGTIKHISISIEALRPKISPKIEEVRENVAGLLGIGKNQVGITATTGEGLTACGKGEGISVFCVLTVE